MKGWCSKCQLFSYLPWPIYIINSVDSTKYLKSEWEWTLHLELNYITTAIFWGKIVKMNIPLSDTSKAPVDINCPSIMFVTKNIRIQAYICVIKQKEPSWLLASYSPCWRLCAKKLVILGKCMFSEQRIAG